LAEQPENQRQSASINGKVSFPQKSKGGFGPPLSFLFENA
jgi:hypothetical protein